MSGSASSTKNGGGNWDGNSSNIRPADDTSEGSRSPPLAVSLTSDEVNYLVYRYLQESGFVHSAFTFVYESMLGKTNIRNGDRAIPPGALISFLQKGLQYVGIEENLHRESKKGQKNKSADAGTGEEADFSLLSQSAIASLTRSNPAIHLNLPAAAAAAAVKARLETQARLQAAREERERKAAATALTDQFASTAGSASALAKDAVPVQQTVGPQSSHLSSVLNPRKALMAPAAAAQSMAKLANTAPPPFPASQQLLHGEISAGLTAMQMALHQQQQHHHHYQQQQLQRQEQQQQQQHQISSHMQSRSETEMQRLKGLSTAPQASTKAAKRTKKTNKKAQQEHATPALNPPHLASQGSAISGFSTLGEAVAMLEGSKLANNAGANPPQPMDLDDNSNSTSSPGRTESGLMSHNAQSDSTKLSTQQELVNGQQSYHPNGSRSSSQLTLAPLNGKSPVLSGGEALTDASSREQMVAADSLSALLSMENQALPMLAALLPPNNQDVSPAENDADLEDRLTNASSTEILELRMHSSEVFMCAWNPVFTSFIATGSGDASARIWQMGGIDAAAGLGPVRLLPHGEDPRDRKNKDVTTLEWSSDGKLLATGSYDGVARVWSRNGALLHTLRGHKGPIFSLKWNKRGNYLLSGSYDKTTIVWDVSGTTGFVEQQFSDHQAPALDVDWKDDTTFASCSTDKTVNICKVGVPRPLKTYAGHTDEVNAVKWDPSGTLLASCSDDCTAKVWNVTSDGSGPLQDFKSHRQEIYTVKWSPTGPGSQNPSKQRILATASFDGSVRLWNVEDGSCIRVFSRHRDSVYSVAFSPSGCFLASGSLAGQLYIWNVQEGHPVKSYKGKGDIFEVAWNKEETRVAACFSSNIVAILDFKIRPY